MSEHTTVDISSSHFWISALVIVLFALLGWGVAFLTTVYHFYTERDVNSRIVMAVQADRLEVKTKKQLKKSRVSTSNSNSDELPVAIPKTTNRTGYTPTRYANWDEQSLMKVAPNVDGPREIGAPQGGAEKPLTATVKVMRSIVPTDDMEHTVESTYQGQDEGMIVGEMGRSVLDSVSDVPTVPFPHKPILADCHKPIDDLSDEGVLVLTPKGTQFRNRAPSIPLPVEPTFSNGVRTVQWVKPEDATYTQWKNNLVRYPK